MSRRVAEHPGACEQIEEMGLIVARIAEGTGSAAARLREIVRERRGVSAETAARRVFRTEPGVLDEENVSKELIENGRSIRARVRVRAGERAAP